MGDLQSSLLTRSNAIVDAATRDAERVDTAVQIFWNNSASAAVNDPDDNGKVIFRRAIVRPKSRP